MLAIRVDFLTGRYVATAYNDRDRAEWPPHPARFFSALVEAWATAEPASGAGEEERMALRWLEMQPAPSIAASPLADIGERPAVTVFVPVNDVRVVSEPDGARGKVEEAERALASAEGAARNRAEQAVQRARQKLIDDTAKATAVPSKLPSDDDAKRARALLPEHRVRQARTFPSVAPADPSITFMWQAEPEATLRNALARLVARVSRLGHSSSLVSVRLVDDPGPAHFIPDEDGTLILRAVADGQVDRLCAAHAQHQQVEPRVLPCVFVRYREGAKATRVPTARSSFGDDWVVLARARGPRLPSTSIVGVATQMRRALLSAARDPIPTVLSGHGPDGDPARDSHLAVVPLIDVAHSHAHGGILGLALVLPRDVARADRESLLRAVGGLEEAARADESLRGDEQAHAVLHLGRAGSLVLERVDWGEHRSVGLRPATWCRPSRRWATATPIALDRHPGDLHDPDPGRRRRAFDEATESVAESVVRIGLPRPAEIDVVRSCVLSGTAKPRTFPRFPASSDRPQRMLVHARLTFAEPVGGPLLLGAGRFFGLGLCRPVDDDFRSDSVRSPR